MANKKVTAKIHGETSRWYIVECAVLNKETGETVSDNMTDDSTTGCGISMLEIALFLMMVSLVLLLSWSVLNVG